MSKISICFLILAIVSLVLIFVSGIIATNYAHDIYYLPSGDVLEPERSGSTIYLNGKEIKPNVKIRSEYEYTFVIFLGTMFASFISFLSRGEI